VADEQRDRDWFGARVPVSETCSGALSIRRVVSRSRRAVPAGRHPVWEHRRLGRLGPAVATERDNDVADDQHAGGRDRHRQ
jgi:hypothetical protein